MKVFDVHAHMYPDAIAQRVVENLSRSYDDIPVQNDGRLDTLVRLSDEAGITCFAGHSVATSPRQVESVNRFVMEAAQAHPGRIMPFASVHPDTPELDRVVDELAAQGFRGVKLHPEFQDFKVDEPRAMRMFAALAGRLPVLLHCGDYRCDNSVPERIKNVIRELPQLQLICAHLGGWTTWESAAAELIGSDIWVDTSSSLHALDAATAVSLIRGYGVDRVLFGTDYPMWTPAEELAKLMALPLTDEERGRILWENHLTLFGENV